MAEKKSNWIAGVAVLALIIAVVAVVVVLNNKSSVEPSLSPAITYSDVLNMLNRCEIKEKGSGENSLKTTTCNTICGSKKCTFGLFGKAMAEDMADISYQLVKCDQKTYYGHDAYEYRWIQCNCCSPL